MFGSYTSLTASKVKVTSKESNITTETKNTGIHNNIALRIYLTICIYATFISLAMCVTIIGPSLIHLTYMYNTDIAHISIALMCNAFGYLVGAVMCGLLYERFNHELQFFVASLFMGIGTAILPWMPNIYFLYACSVLQNIPLGYVDATAQSYIVNLWIGHRLKQPIIQGLHTMFPLGGIISSLIVRHFVSSVPEDNLATIETNSTYYSTARNILSETMSTVLTDDMDYPNVTAVRYPFGIVGTTVVICSFLFLGATLCVHKSDIKMKPEGISLIRENESNIQEKGKKWIYLLLFLFCFFCIWFGKVTCDFLTAFALKGLDWSVKHATLLSTICWASLGIGRIIAIPVSFFVGPFFLLVFCISFDTIGYILMAFVPATGSDILMWITTALVGLLQGCIFASLLSWISNYMVVNGSVASIMFIGISLGAVISSVLTGYLFDNFTHMWMVYLSIIACIAQLIIVLLIYLCTKLYKLRPDIDMDGIDENKLNPTLAGLKN